MTRPLTKKKKSAKSPRRQGTLYIFDEPTTGLHFDDVSKLLAAFRHLIEAGGSVLVIEHNMDVIKTADWVIDLGPEGGGTRGRRCCYRDAGDRCEVQKVVYRKVAGARSKSEWHRIEWI